MIRIFGYYSFNGKITESCKKKMESIFLINRKRHKTLTFNRDALFILYEHARSSEAKNYYHTDSKNGNAYFVVGDIHPCDRTFRDHGPNFNLGRWIQRMRQKNSWSFAKNLRGIYNIVAWEKNRLFLTNDILGLSPMYVFPTQDGCYFCSEAEPIAEMKDDHVVDRDAIIDFLIYGFIPRGRTFFRGLRNQTEGSVLAIDENGCVEKPYASFEPSHEHYASFDKNIDLLKECFKEAVAIRAGRNRVFSALTGGWDTRFTIANLLELKKRVTVFTIASNPHDLAIARNIAGIFKLDHIIKKNRLPQEELKSKVVLRFRADREKTGVVPIRNLYNKNRRTLTEMCFFTSPIFSGCFGTELMGCPPPSFISRLALDKRKTAKLIFSDRFLRENKSHLWGPSDKSYFFNHSRRALQNYVHCFLTQIGRSYLCSHYGRDWERPTSMFGYRRLSPFTDSKFVALLSSLDGRRYLSYRAYEKLFTEFYPDFLKIPWTYGRFRKKSLSRMPLHLNFKEDFLRHFVRKDPLFKNFMRTNKMFNKSSFVIVNRTKELYFLFCWLRDCRDLLRRSDQIPLC
jgi:hypothetical protein